jgi:uncharacterized protein with von Willebrand factor type A (vWA) domain
MYSFMFFHVSYCNRLYLFREKILQEHPHLLDEIEAEAEKMRKENESLQGQLAQAQSELEEEKVKAGEKFKAAFIDDDDNSNEEGGTQDELVHGGEEIISSENEPFEPGDKTENDTSSEEESISNGEQAQDLNAIGDAKIQDSASLSSSTENNDEEEYMDLDNCCDKNLQEETIQNEKVENTNGSDIVEETIESKPGNSMDNANDNQMATENDKNTNDPAIVTVQEFIDEFREQVTRDFNRVFDVILPAQYRGPLMNVIRPMLIIMKNSVKETIGLVKRYTSIILQEILTPRNDSNSDNLPDNLETSSQP